MRYDFRMFVDRMRTSFARPAGDADLYGIADAACIGYTIGELATDVDWLEALTRFRRPDGYFVERDPTHHVLHSTAFALAAMQLCDVPLPAVPALDPYRDASRAVAFLDSLDWRTSVYGGSHQGAAILSIAALTGGADERWWAQIFTSLDHRVDPANGMMGTDKPATGDLDQIGGTFHYHFVYEHFGREMPHGPARVAAVLALQQTDGLWHRLNPVWLTLDGVYMMTRSKSDRSNEVEAALGRVLRTYEAEICSVGSELFTGPLGAHAATAVLSLLAEAQRFLGTDVVVTDVPLRLVLDRRPFI